MARGYGLKSRPRYAARPKHKHSPKTEVGKRLNRLETLEHNMENISTEISEEIERLEKVEEIENIRDPEFAWIKGQVSHLLLQDFVGAAFGSIFFVVTSEVWDIAARFAFWQVGAVMLMTMALSFSLVYASRRRRAISSRAYHHHVLMRCMEIYVVSLVVSALFVVILSTAPFGPQMLNQAVLIALPAAMSAATADLLFY